MQNRILSYLRSLLNELVPSKAFQLLNISISLPVSFYIGKYGVMMSYSYSFPQRVSGEDLDLDPTGFFSLTLSRRFIFD